MSVINSSEINEIFYVYVAASCTKSKCNATLHLIMELQLLQLLNRPLYEE